MKQHLRIFKRFHRDESGSYAIMAALTATVMVGAVGIGLDTYRLENARTELDHVVGLTCDRIENADFALYTSNKARIEMAEKFAKAQVKDTGLLPERTSVKVSQNGSQILVDGETDIDATLMAAVGFKTLEGKSSRDCSPPSNKPPEKACTREDLIYLNPGNFEMEAGTLVAGQKNYAATLYDPKGNIKARQVVGNGSGVTEVFLKSTNKDDMVVVQPFNADGTTPTACNPTIACKGDTKTCPPPDEPVCTLAKAEKLALSPIPGLSRKWLESPGLKAAFRNNTLSYKSLTITTTRDFEPSTYFHSWMESRNGIVTRDTGQEYLDFMVNARLMPLNLKYNANNAKLYRVIYDQAAIWESNGQCVHAISPIVLDLIGKGEITTTGVSSARYVIPQHRVNATVDFDMGGTGKPVRTEWISGNGQALLVDNRDGKAATDMNGTRLFGDLGGHAHGYEKLATLDADKDGRISGDELTGLAAWIDNGDARVQDGELKPLAEVGISELSTVMTETPLGDGGTHLRSTAIMNGRTIMTEDVWFGVDLTAPVAVSKLSQAGE